MTHHYSFIRQQPVNARRRTRAHAAVRWLRGGHMPSPQLGARAKRYAHRTLLLRQVRPMRRTRAALTSADKNSGLIPPTMWARWLRVRVSLPQILLIHVCGAITHSHLPFLLRSFFSPATLNPGSLRWAIFFLLARPCTCLMRTCPPAETHTRRIGKRKEDDTSFSISERWGHSTRWENMRA